jgi:hypothetical protein
LGYPSFILKQPFRQGKYLITNKQRLHSHFDLYKTGQMETGKQNRMAVAKVIKLLQMDMLRLTKALYTSELN